MDADRSGGGALESVRKALRKQQIRQLRLAVGLPALVRATVGVVQIRRHNFAHVVRRARQNHHSAGGVGRGEKLVLQQLGEVEVAEMVHSDLSLEASIGVLLVGQRHDARVEHEEVQSGFGGQEVRGELLDARQGVEVQLLYDDVLSIGGISAQTSLSNLALHGTLAGLHRAGAQNNTGTSIRKSLGDFKTDATVATSDDGSLASQVLALTKVIDDLQSIVEVNFRTQTIFTTTFVTYLLGGRVSTDSDGV